DYAPGTSTKTFTIESWPGGEAQQSCKAPPPPGGPQAAPPQKPIDRETARQLASDITDRAQRAHCENDIMVTGERGFAKPYELADRIRRNTPPTPPTLVLPEVNARDVPASVTFTWRKSTDKDNDPVTYRYYVWQSDELPNTNNAVRISDAEAQLNAT